MTVHCEIELEYASEAEAVAVMEAISPDNAPYAEATREGSRVKVTSTSQTCPQMLHTMEDLLACVRVADEAVQVSK